MSQVIVVFPRSPVHFPSPTDPVDVSGVESVVLEASVDTQSSAGYVTFTYQTSVDGIEWGGRVWPCDPQPVRGTQVDVQILTRIANFLRVNITAVALDAVGKAPNFSVKGTGR